MTTSELKQNYAAIVAHENGKPVQVLWKDNREGGWYDSDGTPLWYFDTHLYRPKPEPVSRPWNCPDDVPGPVCWLREYRSSTVCMIVGMSADGFSISTGGNYKWIEFTKTEFEYSTDRKEWKKCEVTEPAK